MKKKVFFVLLIVTTIITSYYLVPQKHEFVDLAIDNVEALAGEEDGDLNCTGKGSVDCHGYKVLYAKTLYSLKLNK